VLAALSARALAVAEEMSGQNISNTLLALAKLEVDPLDGRLLDSLGSVAERRLHDFNAQALANTLWAFAKLFHTPPGGLLPALCEQAAARLPDANAQNIANSLWALATLRPEPLPLAYIHAAADAAVARLHVSTSQHISNVAWALAKLGVPHDGVMAAAEAHTLADIGRPGYASQSARFARCSFAAASWGARARSSWGLLTPRSLCGAAPMRSYRRTPTRITRPFSAADAPTAASANDRCPTPPGPSPPPATGPRASTWR
jgi:hypothetical protein